MVTAGAPLSGALQPEAFLRLLVTQLRYQNPLNPMDEREFLAQLAQLTQVERLTRVEETLERVAGELEAWNRFDRFAAAGALIGREAQLPDGTVRTIVGIREREGALELLLDDGSGVGLDEIEAVLEAR